jgi:hypothetical protein
MVYSTATKEWMPPLEVFKALNLCTFWCERGPKGNMYPVSKNGWFSGYQYDNGF